MAKKKWCLRLWRKDHKKFKMKLFIKKSSNIISLLILFITTAIIQAVFNIFFLPKWLLILVIIILCFLISKFLFKLKILDILILSFVLAQITWVMMFLPLGYFVQSAVLLIVYYVVWDILKNQNKAGFGKVVIGDLIFGVVLLALLLATSKWMPF